MEEAAWEIVRRIEVNNFDVPGIKVSQEEARDYLRLAIRGQDFAIEAVFPSTSAPFLTRVATPGREFTFWVKDHGLTLTTYAYTDWERDRDWFLDKPFKCHGMNKGTIRYLKYHSKCDCSDLDGAVFTGIEPLVDFMAGRGTLPPQNTLHNHRERWSCPLMMFDNHYKSEYEPIEGESTFYRTEDVMDEMQQWLSEFSLTI